MLTFACAFPPFSCSFDPLGLAPKDDPVAWKDIQTKELNNGRLAMIAIAAFTAEELVSKQEIFEHLALRFEKEAILELDDIERDIGIKNVRECQGASVASFWEGTHGYLDVQLCCIAVLARVIWLVVLAWDSMHSCSNTAGRG